MNVRQKENKRSNSLLNNIWPTQEPVITVEYVRGSCNILCQFFIFTSTIFSVLTLKI